jgi:hypothetical protein
MLNVNFCILWKRAIFNNHLDFEDEEFDEDVVVGAAVVGVGQIGEE